MPTAATGAVSWRADNRHERRTAGTDSHLKDALTIATQSELAEPEEEAWGIKLPQT